MNIGDFFRNILGLTNRPKNEQPGDYQERIRTNEDINGQYGGRQGGTDISTAPFSMHKLFEQQLKAMLQHFLILGDPSVLGITEVPSTTPLEPSTRSPRDEVLKPGYEFNDESVPDVDRGFTQQDIEEEFDSYFGQFSIFQLFENQIHEMFKQFQTLEDPSVFGISEVPDTPSIEPPTRSPRDEVLKPGFISVDDLTPKTDSDLDEHVSKYGIGSLLQDKTVPQPDFKMRTRFSGQSVVRKVIQHPNGGVEREEMVRDSAGNEQRTVTRTLGDQTYSVVTTTGAQGTQTTETLNNIDADKLEDFKRKWDSDKQLRAVQRPKIGIIPDDFPFDKFFK